MEPLDLSTVLGRVSRIATDILAPLAQQTDTERRWPEEGMRALQEACLGGLVVPEESGGLGYGLLGLARVCETLAFECSSTALCFGMHCVGAAVISARATPDQKERYLGPISAGRHLTTLALSEPGTGIHFYLPETTLVQSAVEEYTVSGVKSFVTNGGHADSYVTSTVAADPDAPPNEFSCVMIQNDSPGLVWNDPWKGFGMRGNSSRTAQLNGIRIPSRDLLGTAGDQLWYAFHVVAPYFLMAMAGTYVGVAAAAFEQARAHLGRRTYSHSGGALSGSALLQHRLGGLWAQVERTRQLVLYAASAADAGLPDALVALCSAKAEAGMAAVSVTNEAMTLAGGVAYRDDSRLQRLLRDARAAHVMSPTTDLLQVWAGRGLLGLPLLGD